MSTAKQISFNTIYQIIAKAVTSLATLLVTALITKSFGEAGYGQFVLITSYVALFYLSVDFGLNAITIPLLIKNPERTKEYFQNLVGLRLALATMVILVSILISIFLPYSGDLKLGIGIATFTILSQALFVSSNAIFQLNLRYDLSAVADISSALAGLGLVFLTYSYGGSLLQVVTAYTLASFVRIVLGFGMIGRFDKSFGLSFNPKIWKTFLILAWPLGLAGIFSQVNGYADKFIMSVSVLPNSMDKFQALGIYGLAYKFFEFALVVPTFFINAAYPVMVRHYQISSSKLVQTAKKMYLSMFVISVVGALIGFVLSPLVINFFKKTPEEFSLSPDVLRVLLFGLPIFYLSAISVWLLVTLGKQKYLIWIYAIASLINVILNFLFIPIYGVFAPAVITIVSELVIITMAGLLVRRVLAKE